MSWFGYIVLVMTNNKIIKPMMYILINSARQTLMDEDWEVNEELYNAFIPEYDICGNIHNCSVNII